MCLSTNMTKNIQKQLGFIKYSFYNHELLPITFGLLGLQILKLYYQ